MTLKRKSCYDEAEDGAYSNAKRQNVLPFPSADMDLDVAMSDSSSDSELSPLSLSVQQFHTRLNSDASTLSSAGVPSMDNSPSSSPYYPNFALYPTHVQEISADPSHYLDSAANYSPKSIGLIQPKGSTFTHHGHSCSQIPKLRVACAAGLNGQRTMWAHCEQCGAIEIVDTD